MRAFLLASGASTFTAWVGLTGAVLQGVLKSIDGGDAKDSADAAWAGALVLLTERHAFHITPSCGRKAEGIDRGVNEAGDSNTSSCSSTQAY